MNISGFIIALNSIGLFLNIRNNIFYVTSSSRKEGRSSVSAGLATHLAGMEKKVLLVDLDVKVPMLGGLFLPHVSYEHSLNVLYMGMPHYHRRSLQLIAI